MADTMMTAAEMGRKGGRASAAKLTAAERSARAKYAVSCREKKRRAAKRQAKKLAA